VLERICCSGAWFTAAWDRGQVLPEGMVMSRARTQFSTTTDSFLAAPSRRLTPAIAVGEEDLIDLQSVKEAESYPHPPSISAHVINQIQHMRLRA
jgi:hypothetical protein